jgi:hypothetical protein
MVTAAAVAGTVLGDVAAAVVGADDTLGDAATAVGVALAPLFEGAVHAARKRHPTSAGRNGVVAPGRVRT